jgi:hypothetical protein
MEIVLGGLDDVVNLFGYTDASHNPDKTSRPIETRLLLLP